MRRLGFTVLEVLIALAILTLSLTAIYQTYGTALFSLTTTDTLWRVMSHIQNRLLFHERSKAPPPVSVSQQFLSPFLRPRQLPPWRRSRS